VQDGREAVLNKRRFMSAPRMESTVAAILAPGKGILAADDSLPTIEKRFKVLDVSCTEENRRAYRDPLVTTPGLPTGEIFFCHDTEEPSCSTR